MRRKVYTWEIENEKYHEHGGKGEFHDQRDQDCHLRQDGDRSEERRVGKECM